MLTSPAPIRIALYLRSAAGSAADQESQLRGAVALLGSPHTVAHTFLDLATSGLSLDRPGLRDLLAAAAAHEIDMVMVTRLDRLSRSLSGRAHVEAILASHGVRISAVAEAREPNLAQLANHVSTLSP